MTLEFDTQAATNILIAKPKDTPLKVVTDEQITALLTAMWEKCLDRAEKYDVSFDGLYGEDGVYWFIRTAFTTDPEPRAWDYKAAAVLNRETGVFVKARVTKKGVVHLLKEQPKKPPTIDSYQLNRFGDVIGTAPRRTRVVDLPAFSI